MTNKLTPQGAELEALFQEAKEKSALIFREQAAKGVRDKGIRRASRDVWMPLLAEKMGWKNDMAAFYYAQLYYQSGEWARPAIEDNAAGDYQIPEENTVRDDSGKVLGYFGGAIEMPEGLDAVLEEGRRQYVKEIDEAPAKMDLFLNGEILNVADKRVMIAPKTAALLPFQLADAMSGKEPVKAEPVTDALGNDYSAFITAAEKDERFQQKVSEQPLTGRQFIAAFEDKVGEIGTREDLVKDLQIAVDEITANEKLISEQQTYIEFLERKQAGLEKANLIRSTTINNLRRTQRIALADIAEYPDDLVSELYAGMKDPEIAAIIGETLASPAQLARPNHPAVSPGHVESVICLLSDLHFTEVTRRDDTCGFFPYNSRVAAERLWNVLDGFIQAIKIHRAVFEIDKIYLAILGDLISGTIHLDQVLTNDMTDQAALIFGFTLIKKFITELLALGIPIHLIFTCGNHPRTTPKMPHKSQAVSNMDWVIYEMLKSHFEDSEAHKDGQLTWEDRVSPFIFVDIQGWRHVFAHGTQVAFANDPKKYSSGIGNFIKSMRGLFDSPFYREATGLMGSTFDRFVCGNTHTPINMTLAEVNGCLTGQNELGTNWTLEPIPAVQKIWGVSAKRRRTFGYDIDVTETEEPTVATNPMSEFALRFTERYSRSPYGISK